MSAHPVNIPGPNPDPDSDPTATGPHTAHSTATTTTTTSTPASPPPPPPPTMKHKSPHIYALISYDNDTADDSYNYTQPLILSALASKLSWGSYTLITDDAEIESFLERHLRQDDGADDELSGGLSGVGGDTAAMVSDTPVDTLQVLQIRGYEDIDFELARRWDLGPGSGSGSGVGYGVWAWAGARRKGNRKRCCCLVNAYVIRKALVRKHYLARCVEIACVKGTGTSRDWGWGRRGKENEEEGGSGGSDVGEDFQKQQQQQLLLKERPRAKQAPFRLQDHFPTTVDFELDYAEFLDEALVEAYELKESFERNEKLSAKSRAEAPLDHGEQDDERDWWVLKPGMGDGGQGIRLFSSEEELKAIFEEWEGEEDDGDEDEDEEVELEDSDNGENDEKREERTRDNSPVKGDAVGIKEKTSIFNANGVIISQLRHFVAQRYIKEPLLFPNLPHLSNHKFHIRTYAIAVGSLKVYVYKPMLALFAQKRYEKPGAKNSMNDLAAHLTNTCLNPGAVALSNADLNNLGNAPGDEHTNEETENTNRRVKLFWSLPDTILDSPRQQYSAQKLINKTSSLDPGATTRTSIPGDWKDDAFTQICAITGTVFEAAAREMMIHFQTVPNAFEIFGVDFLLDKTGHAWLLEVNAFPDFKQTGEELKDVVAGLFESVVDVAIKPFFGMNSIINKNDHDDGHDDDVDNDSSSENADIKCVLDVDLGRR